MPGKPQSHPRLMQQPVERPDTLCYRVRAKLKISQSDFAELLRNRTGWNGPQENTVYRWEQGTPPSSHHQRELEKIARENGVKNPR